MDLLNRYNKVKGKAIYTKSQIDEKRLTLETYKHALEKYQLEIVTLNDQKIIQYKALEAVKSIIDKVSREHLNHIQDLVSYGLKTIFFDRNYSLELEVRDLRGSKALEFKLVEELPDGTFITSPFEDGIGGGIKSVVGLILQIYHIQYYNLYPALFMDEALSNISSQYIPTTMEFLKQMSDKKGFKFILVTHDQRLIDYADTIYTVNEGEVVRQKGV